LIIIAGNANSIATIVTIARIMSALSRAASEGDGMETTVTTIVVKKEDVLSAAVRKARRRQDFARYIPVARTTV